MGLMRIYVLVHSTTAILCLESNEETRKHYPYDFLLTMEVTLFENKLVQSIEVTNKETNKDLPFDLLFHTYFKVDDINTTSIVGLVNVPYLDKLVWKVLVKTCLITRHF